MVDLYPIRRGVFPYQKLRFAKIYVRALAIRRQFSYTIIDNANPTEDRTLADNRSNHPNDNGSMPLKPDGTPYTIEEIRQIQAYRRAMAAKRANAARNANGQDPAQAPQRTQPQERANPAQDPRIAASGAYRDDTSRPAAKPRQPEITYRRRKPDKPNPAVLLFIIVALAITVVGITQIVKNQSGAPETETRQTLPLPSVSDPIENGGTTPDTSGETDTETAAEPEMLWNTVTVAADELWKGDLILVNYSYAYPDADTIRVKTVYGNKSTFYQVSNTNIALTDDALTAMNAMADAFYAATGSSEMIIVSGYRNVEDQRRIYNDRVASQGEEMAALYVATPTYSEHHTGLAMDLSFYTKDGKSVAVEDYEYGAWIDEHCADYGFVLRYPSDKIDITKIGYESWHYRYVGIPHAAVMTNRNLCLEEYIDEIKKYTTETNFLWVQSDGSVAAVSPDAAPNEGYLLYYVPKSASGDTEVKIPRGNRFQNYTISGNNVDGYIVTVTLG